MLRLEHAVAELRKAPARHCHRRLLARIVHRIGHPRARAPDRPPVIRFCTAFKAPRLVLPRLPFAARSRRATSAPTRAAENARNARGRAVSSGSLRAYDRVFRRASKRDPGRSSSSSAKPPRPRPEDEASSAGRALQDPEVATLSRSQPSLQPAAARSCQQCPRRSERPRRAPRSTAGSCLFLRRARATVARRHPARARRGPASRRPTTLVKRAGARPSQARRRRTARVRVPRWRAATTSGARVADDSTLEQAAERAPRGSASSRRQQRARRLGRVALAEAGSARAAPSACWTASAADALCGRRAAPRGGPRAALCAARRSAHVARAELRVSRGAAGARAASPRQARRGAGASDARPERVAICIRASSLARRRARRCTHAEAASSPTLVDRRAAAPRCLADEVVVGDLAPPLALAQRLGRRFPSARIAARFTRARSRRRPRPR